MTGAAGTATWSGNSAKARIVGLLAKEERPITVFDYGAGTGGHWPEILPLVPNISLVCFEPHAPSRTTLERRLSGSNARVVSSVDAVDADFIVSFSVFEHVYDRRAYLETARRVLKPGGTFYLSYDDGHFRNVIELARLSFGPLREHLGNLASPLLPWIGLKRRFQRRVTRREADVLVRQAGFATVSERYENLPSMKRLSKSVPPERMGEFMKTWIGFEDELNARFSLQARETLGDRNMLWRELGTRTLELR